MESCRLFRLAQPSGMGSGDGIYNSGRDVSSGCSSHGRLLHGSSLGVARLCGRRNAGDCRSVHKLLDEGDLPGRGVRVAGRADCLRDRRGRAK